MNKDDEIEAKLEKVAGTLEQIVGPEILHNEPLPCRDTKELAIVLVGATTVLMDLVRDASPGFRAQVLQVCVEKTQKYIDEYIVERDRRRAAAEVKASVPVALVKGNDLTN